jgi:hypothetical protein
MNDRILELVYESTKAPDCDYLLIESVDFFVKMIEGIFPRFKNYYIDENSLTKFNLAYFYV